MPTAACPSLSDRHSDRTQSDATETPLDCTELSNNKVEVRAKIGPIPTIVEGRCNANLAARSSDSAAKTATEDEAPEIPKGVKNLRIRKDTAKYLRNLDMSSVYIDPKTRSMQYGRGNGEAGNFGGATAALAGQNGGEAVSGDVGGPGVPQWYFDGIE
eukprot:m.470575 g.470575  ORF g.470575 m.470575 type:complete len:158 (+) comp29996_c0_seq1:44-517(+)